MNNMDLSYEFYNRVSYHAPKYEEVYTRYLIIEATWTDNDGYSSSARTAIPLKELKEELARIP